jgi:putative ABC transport system permease protein
MNTTPLALIRGTLGRTTNIIAVTDHHDPASQAEMAKALEAHLERSGIRVGSTLTSTAERGQIMSQLNVLVVFLLIMAVLLAVVGGIGLMGTMSLNVMERTREIGVLRAIGASTPALLRIVVVEGILIGLISWLLGAALAVPLGMLLSQAVGVSVLDISLSYSYSVLALGLWLAIILILATLASLWPARNAARCSVRQALAYE